MWGTVRASPTARGWAWLLACLLGLSVVLVPAVASAVTANGSQVFTGSGPYGPMTVDCAQADCQTGAITVTSSFPSSATVSSTTRARWYVSTVDPRTLTGWPTLASSAVEPGNATIWASPEVTPTVGSAAMNFPAATPTVAGRWIFWVSYASGSTSRFARGLWDTGYAGPAPTTTAAPTSSTPPASTTADPPSSTTPPASTSSAATSPATDPGTGGTGSTTINNSITCGDAATACAFSLSDDQWGEVLLALACLVFFSAASFVASLRRGR